MDEETLDRKHQMSFAAAKVNVALLCQLHSQSVSHWTYWKTPNLTLLSYYAYYFNIYLYQLCDLFTKKSQLPFLYSCTIRNYLNLCTPVNSCKYSIIVSHVVAVKRVQIIFQSSAVQF